jgi:uncharacterized protein (TIGR02466 family)
MKIIETFKNCVGEISLNENLNDLIKFSKKLKKEKGESKSNAGGFHSKNLNLKELILKSLIKNIEYHSNVFAKEILKINKDLKIGSMWMNINYYKDSNKLHAHPFSIMSGAFYIKTPKNCGNLIFDVNNMSRCFVNPNSIVGYNSYNSSEWGFVPKPNVLYLFPSWYLHYVEPNMSKEERISISFNLS